MIDKNLLLQTIYEAIDHFNEQASVEHQLEKSLDTRLFGKGGKLDSLGLVNLIVSIEEKIEEKFNATITLADERAMSREISPFKTIGSIIDYISLLLQESSGE
jgi:acyl carrier protein